MRRVAVLLLPLLLLIPSSFAQSQLAERQYLAALKLEQGGQAEQAREAYLRLLENKTAGDREDDLLLALARLSWPVEDYAAVATAYPAEALREAQARLTTLWTKHQDTDRADEGGWRLALLHLVPLREFNDPRAALAILEALPTIFPDSARLPQALALAAQLHLEQGRIDRARELAFRRLVDYPAAAGNGDVWLLLARASFAAGQRVEALAAYGRAQQAEDAAVRQRGIDRASLIDRVAFGLTRGEQAYSIEVDADAKGLPGRAADLVFRGKDLLAALPREGKVAIAGGAGGHSQAGVTALAVDARGRVWSASETSVRTPDGGLPLPEGVECVALAVAGPEAVWVADGRSRRVLLVAAGEGRIAEATLPGRAEPVALVTTADGGVWVLDRRQQRLTRLAADGGVIESIELAPFGQQFVDLAGDPLGQIYLLDAKGGAVLVFSPRGELQIRARWWREGSRGRPKASQLAVRGDGVIAVQDGRRGGLIWLR